MSRRLRRTSPVALVLVAGLGLLVGRSLRIVVERAGGTVPTVPWGSALALFALAAIVGALGWSTWTALHRDRRVMASDRAVRLLALAKASAVVGAVLAGGYLGLALSFVDSLDAVLPRERVIRSVVAAVAALALVAAALFLERACEVPRDDDEDDDGRRVSRDGRDGSPA